MTTKVEDRQVLSAQNYIAIWTQWSSQFGKIKPKIGKVESKTHRNLFYLDSTLGWRHPYSVCNYSRHSNNHVKLCWQLASWSTIMNIVSLRFVKSTSMSQQSMQQYIFRSNTDIMMFILVSTKNNQILFSSLIEVILYQLYHFFFFFSGQGIDQTEQTEANIMG